MDCQSGRVCIDLCGTWQILYDPKETFTIDTIRNASGKKSTVVPSVFNVSADGAKYLGVVWYQREVTIPSHEGILELHLEGWYGKAEIYLDKRKLGERLYGYSPFSIYFKFGYPTNPKTLRISIRIDNREQAGQTFKTPVFQQWGGLHRPIALYLHPKEFIYSAQFHCHFNPAMIQDEMVEAVVSCDVIIAYSETDPSEFKEIGHNAYICDPEGNVAYTFEKVSKLPLQDVKPNSYIEEENPKILQFSMQAVRFMGMSTFKVWSVDSPHLYTCHLTLDNGDHYQFAVGIRQIETNSHGELLLNGCPVLFLGANRHDDHPEFGPAFVPQLLDYDLHVMKRPGLGQFAEFHGRSRDWDGKRPSFYHRVRESSRLRVS